jgi:hypothetical protein
MWGWMGPGPTRPICWAAARTDSSAWRLAGSRLPAPRPEAVSGRPSAPPRSTLDTPPVDTGPVDPVDTGPVGPVGTGPVGPVGTGPVGPVGTGPVDPVDTGPVDPVDTGPVDTVPGSMAGADDAAATVTPGVG